MTIPQWALLGFAVWTLLVLFGTVGVYRWSRILTGRVRISEWQADQPQGSDWYRRALRAHMNCVENLPVFAAIVLCATASGANSRFLSRFQRGGQRMPSVIPSHSLVRDTDHGGQIPCCRKRRAAA